MNVIQQSCDTIFGLIAAFNLNKNLNCVARFLAWFSVSIHHVPPRIAGQNLIRTSSSEIYIGFDPIPLNTNFIYSFVDFIIHQSMQNCYKYCIFFTLNDFMFITAILHISISFQNIKWFKCLQDVVLLYRSASTNTNRVVSEIIFIVSTRTQFQSLSHTFHLYKCYR